MNSYLISNKPTSNNIFIATSLDGYIADKNGEIDWLYSFPNPEKNDMGYAKFIAQCDAIIMGRKTFETVLGFDIDWPYEKPVFVISRFLNSVPDDLKDKVQIVNGTLHENLNIIHKQGYFNLYVDGGTTIQTFLKEDLIDFMVITTIPILLGDGIPLFGDLTEPLKFKCIHSEIYLDSIVQNHYQRENAV